MSRSLVHKMSEEEEDNASPEMALALLESMQLRLQQLKKERQMAKESQAELLRELLNELEGGGDVSPRLLQSLLSAGGGGGGGGSPAASGASGGAGGAQVGAHVEEGKANAALLLELLERQEQGEEVSAEVIASLLPEGSGSRGNQGGGAAAAVGGSGSSSSSSSSSSSRAGKPSGPAEQEKEEECCVCLNAPALAILAPCLHHTCMSCARLLQQKKSACPICRLAFTDVIERKKKKK